MGDRYQKKTATVLGSLLIGLIIVSFAFSGYESMRSSPNVVASVDGLPIKIREYSMEYDRQLQFYKQFMGGGNLSSKQLEALNLKERVLNSLYRQKLMVRLAEYLGVEPGEEEIKVEIKRQPYFQTNGKFDLELYKKVLSYNQLTPLDYEEDVTLGIKVKKLQSILREVPVSKVYLGEVEKYKKQRVDAKIVQFPHRSLRNKIPVSQKELVAFLADEKNIARVKSIFEEKRNEFSQQEMIKARHILIKDFAKALEKVTELAKKVTTKNFAELANKNTEDPSGKGKGGDLGWFPRGKMVPEFEKVAFSQRVGTISAPVKTDFGYHLIYVEDKRPFVEAKFDKFKDQIAKELIQSGKHDELKKLIAQTGQRIKGLLESNNIAAIEKMKKDYELKIEINANINRLDGSTGQIQLRKEQTNAIFSSQNEKSFLFDSPVDTTIVKVFPPKSKKEEKKDVELSYVFAQKLQEEMLQKLGESVRIKDHKVIR